MPNMTGEELMEQKEKFIKYNSNTPFLALTANTTNEDIERYLELGFSGVISKPYTISDFVLKIKSVL
jgi:CheY-like chemotaxis protein